MDAIYRDHDGVNQVSIVGVLYGSRVMIRFEGSGECVVPIALLELDSTVTASLRAWQSLPIGWMSDDMFMVLERLSQAGDPGLLDTQYKPLPRHQVEVARRVLKHKGLVGPADGRPSSEGEGRQVRWRLTKQGCSEYVQARTLMRPIAKGGGRQLATAVGSSA